MLIVYEGLQFSLRHSTAQRLLSGCHLLLFPLIFDEPGAKQKLVIFLEVTKLKLVSPRVPLHEAAVPE